MYISTKDENSYFSQRYLLNPEESEDNSFKPSHEIKSPHALHPPKNDPFDTCVHWDTLVNSFIPSSCPERLILEGEVLEYLNYILHNFDNSLWPS